MLLGYRNDNKFIRTNLRKNECSKDRFLDIDKTWAWMKERVIRINFHMYMRVCNYVLYGKQSRVKMGSYSINQSFY